MLAFRFSLFFCLVVATISAPAPQRTQREIQEFREFLLKGKAGNGSLSLEDAMSERPWASAWENSGKFQGDIVLTDDQIEDLVAEYSGRRNGMVNTNSRWPGNTIIYEFAAGHFSNAQQNQIMSAFDMFNTRTCVRFRRRSNERDFVRITGQNDGCYAHVGYMRNYGAHTYNIAWPGCSNRLIIIHEWLHVVGFQHMHQTYPRDDWIQINWSNIANGMNYAFDKHTNRLVTMLGLPYEYASNLHYGSHAFSGNGRPTIVPRRNDDGLMGQLQFVSGWDILRVNRLYNCPGAWNFKAEDVQDYDPYAEVPMEVSDELAASMDNAPVADKARDAIADDAPVGVKITDEVADAVDVKEPVILNELYEERQ